ncbi:M28 family peptidase [Hymenobacter sp. RP-2-7]|uniref:M28 family peptidase n=1 Tax=Hymenobacter polaris TaxID=2682546 RepID=A0A7Y0FMN6_9BACT|nr:M28 family peptidase [Hymenobacter polaris]NML65640.1 M28 family peptidase [Hymenobacter polaris]
MRYAFWLLAALALPAAAQAPVKVKVKTKRGTATAPTRPAAVAPAAPAPPADYARLYAERYITQEHLRRDLGVLASDEYEGRETGTKGQQMAAAYITQQFKDDSLVAPVAANAANPYLQTFSLERNAWQPGGTLVVGGKTYKWLEDFYSSSGRSPFQQPTAVQPVFVGYGIEQGDYDEYKNLDVKGKDVLLLSGEPRTAAGKALLSADGAATKWGANARAKIALAEQKGARAVFLISQDADFAKNMARLTPYIMRPTITTAGAGGGRPPLFMVSPALGLKLLNTSETKLKAAEAAAAEAKVSVASKLKPAKFTISAPQEHSAVSTENVLGFLPGTDLKDEVLVVSAHYDHLGIQNGQVYNGADDDGSGTVGMLSIAQAFAKAAHAGHGPRRSILFLANTGEEKGLLGSAYYAEHPVFPLAATVTDLNIDMIGRTDSAHLGKPDYVYVIGSDKLSSQLHAALERVNKERGGLELDYRFNDPNDPNRFYYRSDHYNFAKKGIPVAFFFNGVHADYHQASDEISKIEFDKLEARARLVYYLAWDLANQDARPVVDSNKP